MKGKIGTLTEIINLGKKFKKEGKTIGLITGCFDILHFGHIKLFRSAKKYCNLLIVGLDSDKTVTINKGLTRPVNSVKKRAFVISELESVDYIFLFNKAFIYGDRETDLYHKKILKKLKPNFLFTNPVADSYWKNKMKRARSLGIKFIGLKNRRSSSSKIIKILEARI